MATYKDNYIEKVLWSIALPGFGQILNGKLVKGLIFIVLEFLININSKLNEVILLSFNGNTVEANKLANYQWLMFYPCIYMFAMWDAYKDSGGNYIKFSFIPFLLSAYLGTIGVIYSPVLSIGDFLLGPIWLPILFLIFGFLVGCIIRYLCIKYR